MNNVRLTARGRKVRAVVILLVVIAAVVFVDWATTPEVCKVPVEAMSGACKRLLFP